MSASSSCDPKLVSRTTAMVFLAGLFAEVFAACLAPEHSIWLGGAESLFAVLYLSWFWLSVAIGLTIVCGWAGKRHRWMKTAAGLTIACGLFAHVASWGLYFQTGSFANWEAVRFLSVNHDMLSEYLFAADSRQALLAIVVAAITLVVCPAFVHWCSAPKFESNTVSKCTFSIWLVLALSIYGTNQYLHFKIDASGSAINKSYSLESHIRHQQLQSRIDGLGEQLNPVATICLGLIASRYSETIEPCINVENLAPRSEPLPKIPVASRKNVILIAVESLRHDTIGLIHNGQEVLPNINRLSRDSVTMTRAYAQSTHSDYADVCLVSSLFPLRSRTHHYYHRDDPWPRTLLHDVLKASDYATAIISSQNEDWGGMSQFLTTEQLDFFYHPGQERPATSDFTIPKRTLPLLSGKFADRHTADVAIDWIEHQRTLGKPFYMSMNLQSSHFPYLIPNQAAKPFQPATLTPDIKFSSYRSDQVPVVKNAYMNGIHECDRQIGRLIDYLKARGIWEETILVVTGENGEAFHENGSIGHACNPTEPTIHVAAILSAPGKLSPEVDHYPMQHVDLVPTILGLLDADSHSNFQGINIFQRRIPASERMLYFHVLSPIARADAVTLGGRWKLMVSFDKPYGVLFDVVNDPEESNDISSDQPEIRKILSSALRRWRDQQLAYYHFSNYFDAHYPPAAPTFHQALERANLDMTDRQKVLDLISEDFTAISARPEGSRLGNEL